MAGKLFPETDIGDSEDVCRRSPLRLETLQGSEDIKESASEGQEPRDKVTSKEDKLKEESGGPLEGEGEGKEETQRPQCTDLLDFRWLQEKEEEEGSLQEQPDITPEEPRVEEILPSDAAKSDQLESAAVDHEAYYLVDDEETLLSDSCASTGYFPCYRTYEEFPRYQPPGRPEDRESGAPRPGRKKIPPTKGPHHSPPSPLPAASVSRKCPQKRKNRGGPEKEQATEGGLKPRLQDQRSLPPNPEEEGKQVGREVSLETERGKRSPQQAPSAGSRTSAKETHDTPSEPRTTPSRLSLRSLVCWVRKIFRKAPPPQPPPQPSTSSGAQVGRPLARRLGRWIAQYRGRIHPQSM